jgi:hypothetical protein
MKKPLQLLLLLFAVSTSSTFAQQAADNKIKKGNFELSISFSKIPINQKASNIDFNYRDGSFPSTIPIDTIKANYNIDNQYFNNAIDIGVSYFINNNFNIGFNARPQINSFLSNQNKNGKVYGVQLGFNVSYEKDIIDKFSITGGLGLSYLIGGYGITSGGSSKKEYLLVNGNELYDQDIGFHIIDNAWITTPEIGLRYELLKKVSLLTKFGYQFTFNRTSRMNFAGELKDGTVKWNSKSYDDTDLSLNVNGQRITNNNIEKLPFNFSGLTFQFGIFLTLIKRNK